MRIMITGGLGYIGSHLAIYLSRAGHSVDIVDNRSVDTINPKQANILQRNVRGIYNYDLRDDSFFEVFEKINYDVIYHFGEDKVISEIEKQKDHLDNITKSANNVIKLIQNMGKRYKECKLIYASSCAVYGITSKYATGKRKIEKLLAKSVPYLTVLRFGNPLGCTYELSYDFFKGNGLAEKLLEVKNNNGKVFPLMTDKAGNSTKRSYVSITELLNYCSSAINSTKIMINVGSHNINTALVVGCFFQLHGMVVEFEKTPLRAGENFSGAMYTNSGGTNWKAMLHDIV